MSSSLGIEFGFLHSNQLRYKSKINNQVKWYNSAQLFVTSTSVKTELLKVK